MLTVADSIGIKLLTVDCLLTGVGNELHQYYLNSSGETVHRQIGLKFKSKIYGISSTPNIPKGKDSQFVVVHGGRDVAIFQSINRNLQLIKHLILNDWISSVQVYDSNSSDDISFCIVSGHSVASEFRVNINGEWSMENKSSCVDKCTLYSSLIIGKSWQETTVFGGNAFGELIIWTVNQNGMASEVLHRLSGHNGVIFSINCAPSENLITTTSDDRSVKIWNVQRKSNECIDWSTCTIEPSKSMFGHTARIFSHKIIEHNSQVYIITVGEDSNICVWNVDGRLVCREPIATNVSLWNLDYDSSRQYLFACGNDGNVHQLNLKDILNESQFLCESIHIKDLKDGEYVEKLVTMQDGIVVMLTNHRKLLYAKIMESIGNCRWVTLSRAENEYKITVLETYGSLVATAGYQFVTIYRYEHGQFNKVFHNKLHSVDASPLFRSLTFITEQEIVICDARGNGSILTVDQSFNIQTQSQFQLPPCKDRWITAAARYDNYLVIGDRHGNMHLYIVNDTVTLLHTLWIVHGNMGCKSIFQTTDNKIQFESAGHQGKVKTILINESTQALELRSTREIPIKWCDKSLQTEVHGFLLAGFNERHFIAWRIDNSYRFEFDCGGGHRAWDLYIHKSAGYLFFVRKKQLSCVKFRLHDSSLHPFKISKNNWHSRPCNTMRIINLTDDRYLIASGGDDNLLKFSEIDMSQSTRRHHSDMVLHISNIRSIFPLYLSSDELSDNDNWMVFSAGGRSQICVTEVKIDQQRNVQFRELTDFMMRSSDLERKRSKQSQVIYFDPETRFMSLVARKTDSNEVQIVVGCSDGYIRCFTYTQGSISLNTCMFYGRCILHVFHFVYASRNYLISMATDGLITFWSLDEFTEDSKPFFTVQHHESGINAFDVYIDANRMIVATGGDDQAIVISILNLQVESNELIVSVLKTKRFPYIHTAQVNGIKVATNGLFVYSASVDQTILQTDLSDFSTQQAGYSCISDAKGLQTVDSNHILIYGCGMQIVNVKNN